MRGLLLSMSLAVLAACGGSVSSTSSNGISQTFTSSASIGEMIDFTIDTDNKTYSYTITQSSYGLSGIPPNL
jgi:hypothetical protein